MSDEINNSTVVKIIAQHTKEFNELNNKYNWQGKKLVEVLNEKVDLIIHRDNLKKENKELRDLLEQATNDCKMAQEGLDGAQREIERLYSEIRLLEEELEDG